MSAPDGVLQVATLWVRDRSESVAARRVMVRRRALIRARDDARALRREVGAYRVR